MIAVNVVCLGSNEVSRPTRGDSLFCEKWEIKLSLLRL